MTATLAPARTPMARARDRAASAWWNVTARGVVWATSIAVAAFWLRGGGIQDLMGGGGPALTTLGRATGLVAANLLLYQVLLMARVPVFERGFGRDNLVRWHRRVGFWSFWLMVAHIVLVVLGYAATEQLGWWDQTVDFVVTYPGMLLATVATGALFAVVALSIRAARMRLRYESWHLLHLYAYLGVGLALPHELWTGADFLFSPAATAYWWTLWALSAAAVVWYRIVVPILRSARAGLRVASVEPDGRRAMLVTLVGRDLASLRVRAGQSFVFRFLDGPGWTRGHPFSVAGVPGVAWHGNSLSLGVRIAGDGTSRMTRLRPGTRVLVEGPYGTTTGERRTGRLLVMIGAGAGVAPLVALLEEQGWEWGEATLITRDHHPADALLTGPIEDLVARRGLRWFRLDGPRTQTGAAWLPRQHARWSGADILHSMVGRLVDADVYLCGPEQWMSAVRADLADAGVPRDRVHTESFSI